MAADHEARPPVNILPAVAPQDPTNIADWRLRRLPKSLTQAEFEVMAHAFADGIKTRPQARKLAKTLSIPESEVAWWKGNAKIGKMVAEILTTKAIHGVAEVLPFVIERAKEDPQMLTVLGKIAGILAAGGGINIQMNQMGSHSRLGQQPEQVIAFNQTMRNRQMSGILRSMGLQGAVAAEAEVVPCDNGNGETEARVG